MRGAPVTFERIDHERAEMVRIIEYFLIASLLVGISATPGLGAIVALLLPFLVLGFVWRTALTVATRGRPSEAIVRARRSHLLGPGGPDDSFATEHPHKGEFSAVTPASPAAASAEARNDVAQGAKVLRPGVVGLGSTSTFRGEL